jgi:hypothetical protein
MKVALGWFAKASGAALSFALTAGCSGVPPCDAQQIKRTFIRELADGLNSNRPRETTAKIDENQLEKCIDEEVHMTTVRREAATATNTCEATVVLRSPVRGDEKCKALNLEYRRKVQFFVRLDSGHKAIATLNMRPSELREFWVKESGSPTAGSASVGRGSPAPAPEEKASSAVHQSRLQYP